jgi:hypothetical protein
MGQAMAQRNGVRPNRLWRRATAPNRTLSEDSRDEQRSPWRWGGFHIAGRSDALAFELPPYLPQRQTLTLAR